MILHHLSQNFLGRTPDSLPFKIFSNHLKISSIHLKISIIHLKIFNLILSRNGNTCRAKGLLLRQRHIYSIGCTGVLCFRQSYSKTPFGAESIRRFSIFECINEGWNVYFGFKFYMWTKHAVKDFPNAAMIGRMDDNVFACTPHV